MSYIGNDPEVNAFTIGVDRFNGTGACTQFTLTRSISDAIAIEVIVNGVQQDPNNSYTVTNGFLTFDEAPSSGINNIIVTYRAPTVVTFNQVTASQIQPNSVTQGAIAANSITTAKLTPNAVLGSQIAPNQISGNLLQNNIISGNNLALYSVSGNNIGLGAISANNFAGGGITSNVLSSNLQISTVRIAETVNVFTTGIGGNVNIDVANATVYYFVANTTANVTFNFRANNDLSLDNLLSIGQTSSVGIALKQGSTRYRANVYIDGVLQTAYWLGNSQPLFQTSQSQSIDSYSFTIIKTAPSTYTVMASNAVFGQANGQGMGGSSGAIQ